MNKIETCPEKSKWYKNCESRKKIKCYGCGFRYFARILEEYPNHDNLQFLGEKFFKLCSENRKSRGGRPRLDKPIWELFKKRINGIKPLNKEKRYTINIGNKQIPFSIKCDGAFKCNDKFFFYEIKGAGDNTNDVLSAITAAQLLKESNEFEKSS